MLTRCLLTAAVALVVVGAASLSSDVEWTIFKKMYNKAYDGALEEQTRRQTWEANVRDVKAHNEMYARGESSYFQEVNEFADMTTDELVKTRMGYLPRQDLLMNPPPSYKSGMYRDVLPKTVDWRKKGYVTPVKNQLTCGSCWAFSSTGALEGQHFRKTGKLVSLSESNLVDCSSKFGTKGCRGGWMDDAFKYVVANKGIDTETSYPYYPMQRKCHFNNSNIGSTDISFKNILKGSEDELQKAVSTIGPISVAVDASYFGSYKGGVLDKPLCSATKLNHAVLVVGYGTFQGIDYWLVKNSWGPSWGSDGYIRMSRNKDNQCGIASAASYPVV